MNLWREGWHWKLWLMMIKMIMIKVKIITKGIEWHHTWAEIIKTILISIKLNLTHQKNKPIINHKPQSNYYKVKQN